MSRLERCAALCAHPLGASALAGLKIVEGGTRLSGPERLAWVEVYTDPVSMVEASASFGHGSELQGRGRLPDSRWPWSPMGLAPAAGHVAGGCQGTSRGTRAGRTSAGAP